VSEGGGSKANGGSEVSELIQALKEAVMELRETVTELTNPLNRLSTDVAHVEAPAAKVMKKVEVIPLSKGGRGEGQADESVARPTETASAKPTKESNASAGGVGSGEAGYTHSNIFNVREAERLLSISRSREERLRRLLRLMRMLCSLRGRVPPSLIERYVNVFVKLGLISEDEGEIVKDVLKALEEGYARGLSVEDQVVLLALIARGLGINDETLEEEAFRVVAESLGAIAKHQRKGGNGPRAEELAGMKEAG